ncbi:MAG: hypothetical protein P1V51_10460 [Deltaproteobacteria bacterium]|nr:hypothetical protein [Deltaproteobacteria bacterium]
MSPRRHVFLLLAALPLLLAGPGCGQRIRYEDTIQIPLPIPGDRALEVLEATVSPALLREMGGTLPDPWPLDAPRLTEDLVFGVSVPLSQADLDRVGEDLAAVGAGDAEARLLRVDFTHDRGDLTHPVVSGEVWVVPEAGGPLDVPGAHRIGTLEGLENGTGSMVFQPGGRRALTDALAQAQTALDLQLLMTFDTGRQRSLPGGRGEIALTVHVDVLK